MKLSYKAVTREGKIIRGLIEAKDINEAASFLRSKELLPTHIFQKKEQKLSAYLPLFKKSSGKDLLFFTRQLASMLEAGLTLMQALRILRDQIQNQTTKDILAEIIVDIEEGKTFSFAIAKFPQLFPPVYISLIKASEGSGLLDRALLRLADNLEKQAKIKSTVKSALMYPSIVVIGMIAVMFIMMIFVIPQLTSLYTNLNVELPMTTKIVMKVSDLTRTFWPLILGSLFIFMFLFRRWYSTEAGKIIVDASLLRLPVFGRLIRQSILTEFTRTLGLLVGSGTLVVESLSQTANVAGNILYKNAILGVSKRVETGITVGDAMNVYPLFPPILVEMVKIGEQTGKLDDSLLRVSEYFEREVDQSVKNLTTAMEPIIMIILGAGVAFLIISIITPIYKLTSSF